MIRLEHIKKEYGQFSPLKDINCTINEGDVVSIIGPSGTGKSTFLRMINMLENPTSGKIFFNDIEITDLETNLYEIRKKIGMVFQSFNLFNHKTVIENLIMPASDLLKIRKSILYDEALSLLDLISLKDKAFSYPSELSGGQKQRVAIARTLIMHPDVILFDEPTSALDPLMVSEVSGVIKKLSKTKGLTILIVTHDIKFAEKVANRVFFLSDGIIYEEGTPQQIFKNPQNEKTKDFINNLRKVEFDLDYNIDNLRESLVEFGSEQGISNKKIISLNLILVEICQEAIYKHLGDDTNISIGLEYIYDEDIVKVTIRTDKSNNIFMDDIDVISKKIIRNLTKDLKYENINEDIYKSKLTFKI